MSRYDVLTVRKDDQDKSYWTRIGVAFGSKDGSGYNIILNALPIGGEDGTARLFLREPKERDDQSSQRSNKSSSRGGGGHAKQSPPPMDDDIPFAINGDISESDPGTHAV